MDDILDFDPLERDWALLSQHQMELLAERYPAESGVNIELGMIRERLAPDAYLLVECSDPEHPGYLRAYEHAETLLAAICITTLLAPEDPRGDRQYSPRPLYQGRAREWCDLPLVINSRDVLVAGHSSTFPWLSPCIGRPAYPMLTSQVSELAAAGPTVARDILENRHLTTDWQLRLMDGARAINAGFQATSVGQLIANMLSAAEVLVALEDKEHWWKRVARLKVLTGPTYWTRVQAILSQRHEYVHRARQPQFGHAAGAIGLCVHTWAVLHEMCEHLEDLRRSSERT